MPACSDGTRGTTASSFSATLSPRARSGDTGNASTLQVQAGAPADPFIGIDPSLPGAAADVGRGAPAQKDKMKIRKGNHPSLSRTSSGRHRRRGVCVAALLWLAFGVGGRAEAGVVLQTPPGLNPGDLFRFVFVTDGIRDATSANIADYDSFVAAQAGGATYNGAVVDWLAIASTASVDAIDHVGQTAAPVYLSDGTLVTTSTTPSGLWSRILVHQIDLDLAANPVHTFVWTGTNFFGTGFGGALGTVTPQVGSTNDTVDTWVASGRSPSGDLRPFYGISLVLTVPPAPVPEPSGLYMLGAALALWRTVRSRHGNVTAIDSTKNQGGEFRAIQ